jgi:hypothetical protein
LTAFQNVSIAVAIEIGDGDLGNVIKRDRLLSAEDAAAGVGDRDEIVFDLAVERRPGGIQIADCAEAEAREVGAANDRRGNIEGDDVVAGDDGDVVDDLLVGVGKVCIAVEVDPGVQLGAGGGIGDIDGNAGRLSGA